MAPSDGSKPPGVPRRDFLGIAVGVSGAAFTVAAGRPLLRFVDPPSRPFGTATVGG